MRLKEVPVGKKLLIIGLIVVLGSNILSLQEEKIVELIQQLGGEDWRKREAAQEKLIEYGTKLINHYRKVKLSKDKKSGLEKAKSDLEKFAIGLREATRSKDPEIRFRTRRFIQPALYRITMPKIAFLSPAPHQIWVADINGINPKQLTNTAGTNAFNGYPTWSSDAQRIAFASNRDGNLEIYTMDSEGKNLQRLTNNTVDDTHLDWSPDGQKIAFTSNRDGNNEIYIMDADGKNPQRLINNKANDSGPRWRSDGKKITFQSNRDGKWQIYVMDSGGQNLQRITDGKTNDWYPTWSPDGQKIAFTSDRDGNREIYTMTIDGNNQKNLTNNFSEDDCPHWGPDGKQIAFRSSRTGSMHVYVMDTDGKNIRRLSPQPGYDPSWSPYVLEELSTIFEPD